MIANYSHMQRAATVLPARSRHAAPAAARRLLGPLYTASKRFAFAARGRSSLCDVQRDVDTPETSNSKDEHTTMQNTLNSSTNAAMHLNNRVAELLGAMHPQLALGGNRPRFKRG